MFYRKNIAVLAEAGNDSFGMSSHHRYMAIGLSCVYIGYMHFYIRFGNGPKCIGNGNRSMGIPTCIDNDCITFISLNCIDEFAFNIALVKLKFYLRKCV